MAVSDVLLQCRDEFRWFIIWCLLHFDGDDRNIEINVTNNRHFASVYLPG